MYASNSNKNGNKINNLQFVEKMPEVIDALSTKSVMF